MFPEEAVALERVAVVEDVEAHPDLLVEGRVVVQHAVVSQVELFELLHLHYGLERQLRESIGGDAEDCHVGEVADTLIGQNLKIKLFLEYPFTGTFMGMLGYENMNLGNKMSPRLRGIPPSDSI